MDPGKQGGGRPRMAVLEVPGHSSAGSGHGLREHTVVLGSDEF